MSLWAEIKQRRITQFAFAYLAGGFMILEGIDQVVDREVLPLVVYEVALTMYLVGILASLVVGWYHGELGKQKAPAREIVLLAGVAVIAVGASGVVIRSALLESRITAPGDLNAQYDPRRVAVLYFDDDSGVFGHVADGLTEALIDELARVPGLDVVSRNGVALYREGDLAPDSIGRALNAGSVITGRVSPNSDHLRVSVSLVDAESGVNIDGTSFTMPLEDLLAARDSVVSSTARFLRSRLGEEVRIRQRRMETASVDAWIHVQRAERLRKDAAEARQHDPDLALALLVQSDSLLRTATALDPEWAEPTVLRAGVALQQAVWAHGADDAMQSVRSGIALANLTLEREPNHARAWETRGTLRHFHWFLNVSPTQQERDALLDGAQSDLETAVKLDPTLAGALNRLSRIYYYERGNVISGALTARQALQADSYLRDAPATLDRLFWAHYDLGQFAEAGRTCSEASGRFPEDHRFKQCELWMMITPTGDPDPTAAWQLLAQVDSLTPLDERPFVHGVSKIIVGGALARANMPDSARSVLMAARVGPEVDPEQELPGYEAIMWTILGDHDEAVQRLSLYVSANPDHQFFEVQGDLHWWWRPLRDHPDFDAVVAPGG